VVIQTRKKRAGKRKRCTAANDYMGTKRRAALRLGKRRRGEKGGNKIGKEPGFYMEVGKNVILSCNYPWKRGGRER